MKKEPSKRINVTMTMPPDLWQRVKAAAEARHQPISWYVEVMLEKSLPKEAAR